MEIRPLTIEKEGYSRSFTFDNLTTQSDQQRFNATPLDVAVDGIGKYLEKKSFVVLCSSVNDK